MKTTVNLPDELVREAQELARRERTELIEAELRSVIEKRTGERRFVLPDASVDGHGLRPAFRGARWGQIRDTIYEHPA